MPQVETVGTKRSREEGTSYTMLDQDPKCRVWIILHVRDEDGVVLDVLQASSAEERREVWRSLPFAVEPAVVDYDDDRFDPGLAAAERAAGRARENELDCWASRQY